MAVTSMEPGSLPRRFEGLSFDADFLTATRGDGQRLRLSRLERALLTTLTARPERLFSREQLLAAMSAEPEELSDRNVDFVINRLRKKLGDRARAPRYIATQYGEGYMWIARPQPLAREGFVVIGPLRGVPPSASENWLIHDAIERLRAQIAARCALGQEIAFLPNWSRGDADAGFRFSVSADFILERGRLQAAFALRDECDGRVIRVVRCEVVKETLEERLREAARRIIGAIWRDLVLAPTAGLDPAGPPLEIRMQIAAMTLSKSVDQGWGYIAARLSEEREATPEDPTLAVMWATYLYARMLLRIDFDSQPAAYRPMEAEIEGLALGDLPAVRGDPILRLGAAKLLFVADPERHLALVEALVNESLSDSAVFAAALSQLGSIQSYRGDLEAAVATYDQALALCEPGAEFHVYLLVKKSTVLIAKGDWAAAQAILRRIVEMKPAARRGLEFYYLSPDETLPETQPSLSRLRPESARAMVAHQMFMFARFFRTPAHARNLLAGMAHHVLPRFGPSILPGEAPESLEWLLDELRGAARPTSAESEPASGFVTDGR